MTRAKDVPTSLARKERSVGCEAILTRPPHPTLGASVYQLRKGRAEFGTWRKWRSRLIDACFQADADVIPRAASATFST